MAEPIHKNYRMEVRKVGHYQQKFFVHISEDGEEGCIFTEEEYRKRKATGE